MSCVLMNSPRSSPGFFVNTTGDGDVTSVKKRENCTKNYYMPVVNVQTITMRHVLKTESVALNVEVHSRVGGLSTFTNDSVKCRPHVLRRWSLTYKTTQSWCVKISQKQFNIFESLGRHDSVNDQRQ